MTFSCAIALLRAINVGRAKRIAMADVRTLFEELGFTGVRTVLNSGNVEFGSPARTPAAAVKAIEDTLVERTGVVSRDGTQRAGIGRGGRRQPAGRTVHRLRAAYVWCTTGVLDRAAAAAISRLLGDATTSRDWNTSCKLHALCTQASMADTAS